MVGRSSIMLRVMGGGIACVVAIVIASAASGCGALIGIEDGIADPGLGPDATSSDATTGTDATTDGAAGNMDAAMTDSSAPVDAAPVATPIAKPGGNTTSLPCGTMTCAIPTESCCAYHSATQPGLYTGVCATTCAPPSGTNDRVATLKCSGPSNCPSSAPRCCYHQMSSGAVETSCQTSCGSGSADVMLCDPSMPSICGFQRSCQHFAGNTMPATWGYCN